MARGYALVPASRIARVARLGAGKVAPSRIASLAAISIIRAAIGARWTIKLVMAAASRRDERSHFNEHTECDDSAQLRLTRKTPNPTTSICHAAKIRQARFGNKPAPGSVCRPSPNIRPNTCPKIDARQAITSPFGLSRHGNVTRRLDRVTAGHCHYAHFQATLAGRVQLRLFDSRKLRLQACSCGAARG